MSASHGNDIDPDRPGSGSPARVAGLRKFCLQVVQFLSTVVMDPHLYFEQKVSAQLKSRQSADEMMTLLEWLVDWLETIGLTDAQREQLDASLRAADMPTYALMRLAASRELGVILATDRLASATEYRHVTSCMNELSVADGLFAARLITDYESRN
jgi:hypothetical protein